MKIFLDTNALIDLVAERYPERHRAMIEVVRLCDLYDYPLWITAHSMCDLTYIVTRSQAMRHLIPNEKTRKQLAFDAQEMIFNDFGIYETNLALLKHAHLNTKEPDFEDALVAEAARRVNADLIISSDSKAFTSGLIPKFTPIQAARYLQNQQRS